MTKHWWINLTAALGIAAILVLFNFGCGGGSGGGGGGGGPTAPTIADVDGYWSGSLTLESVGGCSCIGSVLQLFVGLAEESFIDISQSGSAIQGRWTSQGSGEWCDVTGTVGSESLSVEATSCVTEVITEVECLNGALRDLHWTGATLQATVFGNDMSGTAIETWDCSNSKNGEPAGTLTLQGRTQHKRG